MMKDELLYALVLAEHRAVETKLWSQKMARDLRRMRVDDKALARLVRSYAEAADERARVADDTAERLFRTSRALMASMELDDEFESPDAMRWAPERS